MGALVPPPGRSLSCFLCLLALVRSYTLCYLWFLLY